MNIYCVACGSHATTTAITPPAPAPAVRKKMSEAWPGGLVWAHNMGSPARHNTRALILGLPIDTTTTTVLLFYNARTGAYSPRGDTQTEKMEIATITPAVKDMLMEN
jgi:hypothetical protein